LNQGNTSPLTDKTTGQDEKFRQAFALLERGIEERAFPGAATAITYRGELVALKGLGRFTYDAGSTPVNADTPYDLASLTKVVAATAMCMKVYDQGRLFLQQPVAEVLPEFAGADPPRKRVTFEMLLAHSSGLPAYAKLFETACSRQEVLDQALRLPLRADPGVRSEYSDIGFILVGAALERLSGQPLEQFCKEVFAPLGVAIAYCPGAEQKPGIPPTESDISFRHKIVQGEVHDENAWVMGGVAGHAGCFGTAEAVAGFAECMLRRGTPLFQPHTVELFTQRQASPAGTSRALGWDTPSAPSQSGRYFSPKSYGHLGYTGTSLWIDPERQLSVTLLTNRTWPDRRSQAIKEVRPAFHDAVVEAIQATPSYES
jgi:CubicO group peptidase (beta-lactamase class C family)